MILFSKRIAANPHKHNPQTSMLTLIIIWTLINLFRKSNGLTPLKLPFRKTLSPSAVHPSV